jgi:hypothetical protein
MRVAARATRPPLVSRPDRQSAPLTPLRHASAARKRQHPGRAFHNLPRRSGCTARSTSRVSRRRCEAIVERQPALRTRIALDSQAARSRCSRSRRTSNFALPTIDLRGLPADQREAELADRMQELADRPIDIHAAPMAHAALFQLDDEDHAFVFVPHQLVWDDASFDLLQRELRALYDHAPVYDHAPGTRPAARHPKRLPALASTQGDHAEWLADWMRRPRPSRHSSASGANAPPQLPGAAAAHRHAPPRTDRSGQGGAQPIGIDLATTQRLRDVAHGLA